MLDVFFEVRTPRRFNLGRDIAHMLDIILVNVRKRSNLGTRVSSNFRSHDSAAD
jgi:hypothetical protein